MEEFTPDFSKGAANRRKNAFKKASRLAKDLVPAIVAKIKRYLWIVNSGRKNPCVDKLVGSENILAEVYALAQKAGLQIKTYIRKNKLVRVIDNRDDLPKFVKNTAAC